MLLASPSVQSLTVWRIQAIQLINRKSKKENQNQTYTLHFFTGSCCLCWGEHKSSRAWQLRFQRHKSASHLGLKVRWTGQATRLSGKQICWNHAWRQDQRGTWLMVRVSKVTLLRSLASLVESLTLGGAEPVFWWCSESGCMDDRRSSYAGVSAAMLFRRSKCRMLRLREATSVFPFQPLYFGRVLQVEGRHRLPKSLRKHPL